MRPIRKDFQAVPQTLRSQKKRLASIALGIELNYGGSDVREALEKIYLGKCAYCESRQILEIEHFRPKASVDKRDLEAEQAHNGYYWLQVEWSNLLYACHDCNYRGSKGTRFPIRRNMNRVFEPKLGSDNLPTNCDVLLLNKTEEPLLLNPEIDNPYQHLRIDSDGLVIPLNNSDMARVSIDVYKLGRAPLKQKRQKIIDAFIVRIENQLAEYYKGNLNNAQVKQQLIYVFKDIAKLGNPEMEFTLISFSIIENLPKLLLFNIPEEFHPLVMDTFLYFCETESTQLQP